MTYFASNIKILSKSKGYSQKDLAEALDTANTTISSWYVGKSKPTVDTLLLLKDILEVSLDDLFFKDFTNELDLMITKKLDNINNSSSSYHNHHKEVTILTERECKLTGGMCAFEMLPELKAENEKLKQELAELKKNK